MAVAGTPTVKVYYGKPILPDVSRVLACLYEKDVQFKFVDMYEGQQMPLDFLKLQASTTVPVIAYEDGSTLLFESRAICRYISEKHPHRGNKYLLGRDLLERTSIEQWLKSEEQSFNPPSWTLVFHLAFAPLTYNNHPDRLLLTQCEQKLAKVLDVYEQRLTESTFLAGNDFTLADLSHLPNSHYLANSSNWGDLFDSRKNVRRWFKEISNRPSWRKVVDLLDDVPEGSDGDVPIEKATLQIQRSESSGTQPLKVVHQVPAAASFTLIPQPSPSGPGPETAHLTSRPPTSADQQNLVNVSKQPISSPSAHSPADSSKKSTPHEDLSSGTTSQLAQATPTSAQSNSPQIDPMRPSPQQDRSIQTTGQSAVATPAAETTPTVQAVPPAGPQPATRPPPSTENTTKNIYATESIRQEPSNFIEPKSRPNQAGKSSVLEQATPATSIPKQDTESGKTVQPQQKAPPTSAAPQTPSKSEPTAQLTPTVEPSAQVAKTTSEESSRARMGGDIKEARQPKQTVTSNALETKLDSQSRVATQPEKPTAASPPPRSIVAAEPAIRSDPTAEATDRAAQTANKETASVQAEAKITGTSPPPNQTVASNAVLDTASTPEKQVAQDGSSAAQPASNDVQKTSGPASPNDQKNPQQGSETQPKGDSGSTSNKETASVQAEAKITGTSPPPNQTVASNAVLDTASTPEKQVAQDGSSAAQPASNDVQKTSGPASPNDQKNPQQGSETQPKGDSGSTSNKETASVQAEAKITGTSPPPNQTVASNAVLDTASTPEKQVAQDGSSAAQPASNDVQKTSGPASPNDQKNPQQGSETQPKGDSGSTSNKETASVQAEAKITGTSPPPNQTVASNAVLDTASTPEKQVAQDGSSAAQPASNDVQKTSGPASPNDQKNPQQGSETQPKGDSGSTSNKETASVQAEAKITGTSPPPNQTVASNAVLDTASTPEKQVAQDGSSAAQPASNDVQKTSGPASPNDQKNPQQGSETQPKGDSGSTSLPGNKGSNDANASNSSAASTGNAEEASKTKGQPSN